MTIHPTVNPRRVLRGGFTLAVTLVCGLTLLAGAARAAVTIDGIKDNQVVTGTLKLTAQTDNSEVFGLTIQVVGPDGFNLTSASDRASVTLAAPGDLSAGAGGIDTAAMPEGRYSVTAYSAERTRSGTDIETHTRRFTVKHPAPGSAPGTAPVVAAEVETVVETGSGVVDLTPVLRTPVEQVVETVAATPDRATLSGVSLRFANDAMSQRTVGDNRTIDLVVEGDMPAQADVMVIVWDQNRTRLVNGFVKVFKGGPYRLDAALLDKLPAGKMEVQAHLRVDGRVYKTVKHTLTNNPRPLPEPEDIPAIQFAPGAASTWTVGSTGGIGVQVDGTLPAGTDILVLAWSLDQSKMVAAFAHELKAEPFTITAAQLAKLPVGKIELQLRPRINHKIIDKIVKTITVKAPQGDNDGGDDGTTDPDTPGSETPDPETPDPNTPEPDTGGDDGTANPTPDTPGNPGNPGDDGEVVDLKGLDVSFAGGGGSYTKGSGEAINLSVSGKLPGTGDVLVIAWHNGTQSLVGGFAHEIKAAPYRINNNKLDTLAPGSVQLQALLRVNGKVLKVKKLTINVKDPAGGDDGEGDGEEPEPDDGGEPDYDGLPVSAAGFTVFTKSADSRVYYVAQNGSDSNDGLSTGSPLKTAEAGFDKLRDGHADWLLFKAGDSFSGSLGTVNKSGRSAKEKILIGVYGEGDRPKMLVQDGSWANKGFQHKGDHIAFVGLHFIADRRNPHRSGFSTNGWSKQVWEMFALRFLGKVDDVLVEDCIVEYFTFGLVFQSDDRSGWMTNVKLRRTAVLNSYGHPEHAGHSSGIFTAYTDGLLIEGCVFDANGYHPRVDGANPTKFNHNIYNQKTCKDTVVRNTIITRASSHGMQLRGGGEVDDCLFVSNPLGFFVAKSASYVHNNVVLQSDDISDKPGDWRGEGLAVLPCVNAVVEGNIFAQKTGRMNGMAAINVAWESESAEWLDGRPYKVTLRDNKVYQWPRNEGTKPAIALKTDSARILADERNAMDKASGGDSNPPWKDPSRDVESYMKSINKTATLDAFVESAAFRPRGQWIEQFSASAVNTYIRRGFDVTVGD